MQKKDSSGQSIVQVFFRKEAAHKPKESDTKNLLSSVYVIETTCFDEWCLFHLITYKISFLQKFIVTMNFFQLPYFCAH